MNSNKPTPQDIAAQLKKPEGSSGIEMGEVMNDGNKFMNKIKFNWILHNELLKFGSFSMSRKGVVKALEFEQPGQTHLNFIKKIRHLKTLCVL